MIQLYALSLSQTSNYFLSVCIFVFCPVIIHQVIDYFAQCAFISIIERCSAAMPTIMFVIRFQLICLYCLFHFAITNLSLINVLSDRTNVISSVFILAFQEEIFKE